MRARERGWHVVGHDISSEAATIAKERSALDEIVSQESIYRCDVAVIALPVEATISELRRLGSELPSLDAGLIIDIASVKLPIVEIAQDIPNFVATHPFAGRERSGAAAADATLFDGKSWVYVSSGDVALDKRAEEFIREMGSAPYAVGAIEHDRIVACTSHLPQLLAWLFAERNQEEEPAMIAALSGPVARELQRIARSERQMWREIFRANSENICREARALAEHLLQTVNMLERNEDVI